MGKGERRRTYGDVSLQIAHNGCKRGILEEFCRGVESWVIRVISPPQFIRADRWNEYVLNKRTTPSDASRKARVSIPASVMGTSAKD
jgi:hypothetical protein